MRLGVIDWGIGGLDAWRRLRRAMPEHDYVYWSDAGFTPYGKVPADALHERLRAIVESLGADAVVIACNAASTVLDGDLGAPALGVIDPGVRLALADHDARTIGVLGGDRTIASGLHAAALEAAGRRVVAIAAQPLSAHVEAGRLDGPELLADLAPRVAALAECDATLLACTHYPALAPVFERLAPRMRWLDPVDGLIADAVTRWGDASRASSASTPRAGTSIVGTTGDPHSMRSAALSAFGVALDAIIEHRISPIAGARGSTL